MENTNIHFPRGGNRGTKRNREDGSGDGKAVSEGTSDMASAINCQFLQYHTSSGIHAPSSNKCYSNIYSQSGFSKSSRRQQTNHSFLCPRS